MWYSPRLAAGDLPPSCKRRIGASFGAFNYDRLPGDNKLRYSNRCYSSPLCVVLTRSGRRIKTQEELRTPNPGRYNGGKAQADTICLHCMLDLRIGKQLVGYSDKQRGKEVAQAGASLGN